MKRRIRVNPKTHLACVPTECIEDGIVGDVEAYADAVTLTLVSKQANLKDIRSSLETVLRDVDLRLELEERNQKLQSSVEKTKGQTSLRFDELRQRIKTARRQG